MFRDFFLERMEIQTGTIRYFLEPNYKDYMNRSLISQRISDIVDEILRCEKIIKSCEIVISMCPCDECNKANKEHLDVVGDFDPDFLLEEVSIYLENIINELEYLKLNI